MLVMRSNESNHLQPGCRRSFFGTCRAQHSEGYMLSLLLASEIRLSNGLVHQATCPCLGQSWSRSMSPYGVIRAQVTPICATYALKPSSNSHTEMQYIQGWGVTKPISSVPIVSALRIHTLAIEYHVYIWQVSPQLSCGDTCQIWM